MGTDKAFVTVDGRTMVQRVTDALAEAGATPVVAIGGDAARLTSLGLSTVPDRCPGEGPLGGLTTALHHSTGRWVLVAGCDQPWLRADLLRLLLPTPGHENATKPRVFEVDGRPQPLPGCYPTSASVHLARRFDAGHRRLGDALAMGPVLVALPTAGAMTVRDVDRLGDLRTITLPPREQSVEAYVEVPEIDVNELAQRQAAGTVVVDVRNPDEYTKAHVPGARLIPLPEVPDRLDEVPTDQPVLVICRSGSRSMKAAQFYVAQGVDATNVAGGTMAWIDSGRPFATGESPG